MARPYPAASACRPPARGRHRGGRLALLAAVQRRRILDGRRLTECGGSSRSPSAVAYSALHALPRGAELPRPRQQRTTPKADAQHLGVSSSQLQAAQQACRHLLPNNGGAIDADSVQQCMMAGDCPPALVQQVLNEERSFA